MAAVQVAKNTANFQRQMNLHFSLFFSFSVSFLRGLLLFVCF